MFMWAHSASILSEGVQNLTCTLVLPWHTLPFWASFTQSLNRMMLQKLLDRFLSPSCVLGSVLSVVDGRKNHSVSALPVLRLCTAPSASPNHSVLRLCHINSLHTFGLDSIFGCRVNMIIFVVKFENIWFPFPLSQGRFYGGSSISGGL